MRRSLLWSIAALTALTVWSLGNLGGGTASAARRGANYFPNLPVVTHEGKTLRFYEDLVKGKIVVINFIYTSCPDICSLSTATMALVQKWLGERVGRDVFIYSISLDPENDSPEVLKEYAAAFKAGPGWLFLTGKPEDIHLIRWQLGERSRTLDEHRSDMVLGNDATGEWRRISLMGNLKLVTQRILEMDPKRRAQRRAVSVESLEKTPRDYQIRNRPGEALYLKACAACHTVGNGDRVGPDLNGVTTRRDRTWLIRYLVAPEVLRARKDPIAVELDARYEGVTMPNLGLSEVDAGDLIVYLETQMNRLSAEAGFAKLEPGHDHHNHDNDNDHDHDHGHNHRH
jgi:cytochrome oxidase Cu insertion factor (SCO1/SenC/PrrC family)/mono/diheme cytochrome c family protein